MDDTQSTGLISLDEMLEQDLLFRDLPSSERRRALAEMDISFLHKSFCVVGLPLRAPKKVSEPFTRNDDRFALTVTPHRFMLPSGRMVDVGVPFGPKARLLAMWMATEVRDSARRSGDRWLEIGKVMQWLESINIKPCTTNLYATKEQLVRLSFSQFTMVMKSEPGGDTLFKRDALIESGIFEDADIEHYADQKFGKMRWPKGLQLSQPAYERFTRHSIPVPTSRLAKISHSALAIDIFVYLSYRLPMISPCGEELTTWRQLIAQFGNGEAISKFRETFSESIRNALGAYPEARVELTDEGLRMRYSDPADLRRAFVAVPRQPISRRSPSRRRAERVVSPVLLGLTDAKPGGGP